MKTIFGLSTISLLITNSMCKNIEVAIDYEEAVANYMSECLTRLTEEIIHPDKPEQESDNDDSLIIDPVHRQPPPPPYFPPIKKTRLLSERERGGREGERERRCGAWE